MSFVARDPNVWSGRAVQEVSSIRQVRSCINVSGLCLERLVLRAIMDISAHAVSLGERPQTGAIWVTSVRMRREDRSSISTYPLADLGWKLLIGLCHRLSLISRCSFVRAKGPFLRPGPQNVDRVARRGRSRPAVALGACGWRPALPGPRLDRAEHGARIKRVGRLHRRSSSVRRNVP